MMPGGTAVRTAMQISYNVFLYYTFFDKPYFFNAMQS